MMVVKSQHVTVNLTADEVREALVKKAGLSKAESIIVTIFDHDGTAELSGDIRLKGKE